MSDLSAVPDPSVGDLAALVASNGGLRSHHLGVWLRQCAGSDVVGFADASGRLIAAVGLWPTTPGAAELWFVTRPDIARHLPALRKVARRTLDAARDTGLTLTAHVLAGHVTGQRLARIMGLRFAGMAGAHERWTTER